MKTPNSNSLDLYDGLNTILFFPSNIDDSSLEPMLNLLILSSMSVNFCFIYSIIVSSSGNYVISSSLASHQLTLLSAGSNLLSTPSIEFLFLIIIIFNLIHCFLYLFLKISSSPLFFPPYLT